MKMNKRLIAGAFGATIAAADANAALTGLSSFLESPGGPGAPPPGGSRFIYRVYANFSSSTDRVLAWGIGSDFGTGSIREYLGGGFIPGNGFTNVGGAGGQIAPYSPGTSRDWDSFMTIGVLYGNEAPGGLDATTQIPNTPVFITNGATSWTADPVNGGGVFITPDNPQGRADYRVSGNDTDHRVLLMQLVVNAGEYVKGTIGVLWQNEGGGGKVIPSMEFGPLTPPPPAPGGLPLLACAGLFGVRRRRES